MLALLHLMKFWDISFAKKQLTKRGVNGKIKVA
jgi:hypothetical protein